MLEGSAVGTSPMMFTYTIPLTTVSNDARIRRAVVQYGFTAECPVTSESITDDFGSVTNGNQITWGADGAAALNAANVAGSDSLQVTATCNFTCSGPPPHEASFAVVAIDVDLCEGEFN